MQWPVQLLMLITYIQMVQMGSRKLYKYSANKEEEKGLVFLSCLRDLRTVLASNTRRSFCRIFAEAILLVTGTHGVVGGEGRRSVCPAPPL